jgi:hypothetical protein
MAVELPGPVWTDAVGVYLEADPEYRGDCDPPLVSSGAVGDQLNKQANAVSSAIQRSISQMPEGLVAQLQWPGLKAEDCGLPPLDSDFDEFYEKLQWVHKDARCALSALRYYYINRLISDFAQDLDKDLLKERQNATESHYVKATKEFEKESKLLSSALMLGTYGYTTGAQEKARITQMLPDVDGVYDLLQGALGSNWKALMRERISTLLRGVDNSRQPPVKITITDWRRLVRTGIGSQSNVPGHPLGEGLGKANTLTAEIAKALREPSEGSGGEEIDLILQAIDRAMAPTQ